MNIFEIQVNTLKGQLSLECEKRDSVCITLSKEQECVSTLMGDVDFLTSELNNAEEDLKTEQEWKRDVQCKLDESERKQASLLAELRVLQEQVILEESARIAAEKKTKELEAEIQNMVQESEIIDNERQRVFEDENATLKKSLAAQMKKSEILTKRLEKKIQENRSQMQLPANTKARSPSKAPVLISNNKKVQEDDIPMFMRL